MNNWEKTRDLLMLLALLLLWLKESELSNTQKLELLSIFILPQILFYCLMWLLFELCKDPKRRKLRESVILIAWSFGFIEENKGNALWNALAYVDQLPAPPASAPPA